MTEPTPPPPGPPPVPPGPPGPPGPPPSYPPYPTHPPYPPHPPHPPTAGGPRPPGRRVLPVVLAVAGALLLVAAAVLVPLLLAADDEPAARERSGGASETTAAPDLAVVEEYDDLPVDHVPDGTAVDYPQSPPVGGQHAPYWLECGVYDEPVPVENLVHSLEHGTVWITYRPDEVDDAAVAGLADQLPDEGILSPYPDQEAPVVVTVWGRQLALDGPDDARLALFVAEYGAGDTAPEPLASCHGGVTPEQVPGGSDHRIA